MAEHIPHKLIFSPLIFNKFDDFWFEFSYIRIREVFYFSIFELLP